MINYDHARQQIESLGLLLDKPLSFDGRIQRWRVAGEDQEKRGWTRLREWTSNYGNTYIVGAYGVWHGNDDGYTKIELPARDEMDADARHAENQAIREANKAAQKAVAEARKVEAHTAARWAAAVWAHSQAVTEHDYLTRKRIQPHGARLFTSTQGLLLEGVDDSNWYRLTQACLDGHGALVIPMHDARGQVVGLQFIYGRGHPRKAKIERDKEFWPAGMAMGGSFGLIGPARPANNIMLIAEGFATAASLFEATGYSVCYAFSANNLAKAAEAYRAKNKGLKILFCADDDYLTEGNPGCTEAAKACAKIDNSAWTKPDFTDDAGQDRRGGKKLTDYNDLAILAGIPLALADQINASLDGLGWRASSPARVPIITGGGEGAAERISMLTPEDVVERFSPVWSEEDVYYFDHIERVVVKKPSIANRMPRGAFDLVTVHPAWKAKPEVPLARVDFDPTEADPAVSYNLWGGWPEIPSMEGEYIPAGEIRHHAPPGCTAILRLLRHLCSHEHEKQDEIYEWIIRWLAYPIQNPGAKMQSCILMHGGQGAGKNTVFDTLLDIYGMEYAVEFGPSQLEKRFNALFSKKMFAIGNEVVASREDLYHVKGHIKHMITERRWVVEAKNKDERWERNCCNFIFLSNEINAQALDKGDRRHCVVWTPSVPDPIVQAEEWSKWQAMWAPAHAERKNGGHIALYHYLKSIDLNGFSESTWPPMTQAKQDLIDLNMDSRERFYSAWRNEEIGLPCIPVPSELLHDGYRTWTQKVGIGRPVAMHSLMAFIGKQPNVRKHQDNIREGQRFKKVMVVYPPFLSDPPPGQTRATWLADCADEFKQALDAYRG